MFKFKITHQSNKSKARTGVLKTAHGEVETPTLVPVATQAVIKTMTSKEMEEIGFKMMIANTYHLHIRPGEAIVKKAGGLHKFMDWGGSLMTDSGGFQVFSLGFGKDYGTGKILKQKRADEIELGDQPKLVKITEDGVEFRSYVDGKKLFIGPKESMAIQADLGADIIFAFDECTSPISDKKYTIKSLEKTHRWARVCIDNKPHNQSLFGIVQGGKYEDLRKLSAENIGALGFQGFGIGGEFGDDKQTMGKMLGVVNIILPEDKPKHLLGIGYPEDIETIVKNGVDTFDCIVPTHYARHGVAFTQNGRLDLRKNKDKHIKNFEPIDKSCLCETCQTYSTSYIAHLYYAHEITALRLLTFHNLHYFYKLGEKVRDDINNNRI